LGHKFTQGFFIAVGFDRRKSFGLLIPTMSPSSDGFDAEPDLQGDLFVVLFFGGEQNQLGSPSQLLRRIMSPDDLGEYCILKLRELRSLRLPCHI